MDISLSGKWNLIGTGPNGETKKLDATIPGHVHVDLENAGIIPPIFYRDNAEKCQWVEHWHWTYQKEFDVPKGADTEHSEIVFEGLDTFATVFVNGIEIGKCEDMFITYRFPLAKVLREGKNEITVRFDTVEDHTKGLPDLGGAFFTDQRGYVRRIQCTFYWDWVERLLSYGIWRPVTIRFNKQARIESVSVLTRALGKTSTALEVILETEFDRQFRCSEKLEILDPDGKTVWSDSFEVWSNVINMPVDIRDARLWWPNGYGEQPLYTAVVTLYDEDKNVMEVKKRAFGIRTVRVEMLRDAPGSDEEERTNKIKKMPSKWVRETDRSGQSFITLVNDERIFCSGGNWVPADPFPSRITKEKYENLIALAKEGGMNMLRCWGGGIYEPEEFFDACDKNGILITQDFIFGCMPYPQTTEFYNLVRKEIEGVIKRLRSHPSLAWWTGNNEDSMCSAWDDRFCADRVLTSDVIEPTVRALDPTRYYFPTSPYNGNTNLDNTKGDAHTSSWEYWENEVDYREFYRRAARFESEHCLCGILPKNSLLKFMNEDDLTDTENKMFEFHDKSFKDANPTLFKMLGMHAVAQLGEFKDNDDRLLKLQYVQYESTRLALESRRRARWYNSGILFWMFNDCWPAVGWSNVGYDMIPKAGWYACKKINQPIIASIDDTDDHKYFRFYVLNNGNRSAKGRMTVSVVSGNDKKTVFTKDFVSEANENQILETVEKFTLKSNEILIAELSGDACDTAVYYPHQTIKEVDIGTSAVFYMIDENKNTITFKGSGTALCVAVEGEIILSENYFNLYPGQTKTVSYKMLGGHSVKEVTFASLNGTVEEEK